MKQVVTAAGLSCVLILTGCAVTPFDKDRVEKQLNTDQRELTVQRSATYIREVTPQEELLKQRISVSGSMALVDAIKQQLPGVNIQPGDSGVDITRIINVYANLMPVDNYLEYLSALTGYHLMLQGNSVQVRSFVTREWNMATFASNRQANLRVGGALTGSSRTGGDLGSTQVTGGFNNDEWDALVAGAKRLLESDKGAISAGRATPEPYVNAVRSIGVISAGGDPARMKLLDQYFRNLIKTSHQQINISVRAYDVILNDEKGAGVNWKEISNLGSLNGNPLKFGVTSEGPQVQKEPSGLFRSTFSYEGSKGKADGILQFLQSFGDVELLNQPNITVRNGSYAYFSTGEEFSFIGEIEIVTEGNNAEPKVGVKIETIEVGVRLAVVPRILDDGRILLDIWPVVSSRGKENVFSVNDIDIVRHDISLQELSTEVITETGRPIQLGGFIRRSVEQSLEELPWIERITGKIVKPLFRHQNNKLSRRELVITVTPTIVEGV